MSEIHYNVGEVFVAGGQPSLTYIDRQSSDVLGTLENRIRSYLSVGFKALAINGPTKSGKTVVCRKVVPKAEGIWLEGGTIRSEEEFWIQVCQQYEVYTSQTKTNVDGHTVGGSFGLSLIGKLPLVAEAGGTGSINYSGTNQSTTSMTVSASLRLSAINALLDQKLPVIIDDFHYIERNIQTSIIRSLKGAIFDGLRVIFIAVPHRAFDAVRSEREMTGRVDQLAISLWNEYELKQIATAGFPLLKVDCADDVVNSFVSESQGSPHLMQEFCSRLCVINNVTKTSDLQIRLQINDKQSFFKQIASSTAKPAFDRLARGPRQRTDRKPREFADGTSGDIYLAVLKALAKSGAKTQMTYEDIRASLRNILASDVPQAHEVTRVLDQMTKIAKTKIEGEAVIEWDSEDSVLHIADPFFAFYLRWHAS